MNTTHSSYQRTKYANCQTPRTLYFIRCMNSKTETKKRITKIPFSWRWTEHWTCAMCALLCRPSKAQRRELCMQCLPLIKMECYWISSNASSIETKRSNGASAMEWMSEFMTEPMPSNQHRSLSPAKGLRNFAAVQRRRITVYSVIDKQILQPSRVQFS